jgi:hypothetical protein
VVWRPALLAHGLADASSSNHLNRPLSFEPCAAVSRHGEDFFVVANNDQQYQLNENNGQV